MIPARLKGRRIGRGDRARDRGDAARSGSTARAGAPSCRPAKRLAAGRRRAVRRRGQGLLPRPARRDGGGEGRGRRGDARVRVPRPGARPGDRGARRHAAAALHRRARAPDEQDRADYQTMFAREEGSVAAPTAGLHFTDELLARLQRARHRAAQGHAACRRRARSCRSRPRTPPATGCMPECAALSARRRRRRSTRRARTAGASSRSARRRCGCWKARRAMTARSGRSPARPSIFITPGYRFRAVDVMMTNFHLPRSTLFMLVVGVLRARDDEARLCARDRGGLSLLFLWRCLLAIRERA